MGPGAPAAAQAGAERVGLETLGFCGRAAEVLQFVATKTEAAGVCRAWWAASGSLRAWVKDWKTLRWPVDGRKRMEITENQWKSMKTDGNRWKTMENAFLRWIYWVYWVISGSVPLIDLVAQESPWSSPPRSCSRLRIRFGCPRARRRVETCGRRSGPRLRC